MATKPGEANFFPDVPTYPEMGTFQPVYGKFDLTTYIQGASDYEIMAFLVGKYNACLEAYDKVTKLSTDTITAAHQLQDWINTWFDNLDVQQELNNKINSMVADGSFGTLLHQTFDTQINQQTTSAVTAWLVANVTPTGSAVVVDKSLSIEGAAADAYSVGSASCNQLFTPESGIIQSSEIGSICSLNVLQSGGKHCIVNATEGAYLITYTNANNNGVMFLDNNNTVLGDSSYIEAGTQTRIFYAPKNTAKIVVNVYPPYYGLIANIGNEFNQCLLNTVGNNHYYITPIAGNIAIGNVGETLSIQPVQSDIYHTIFTVQPKTQALVSAYCGENVSALCFIDANNKILAKYNKVESAIITAPENTSKIAINFYKGWLSYTPITYNRKYGSPLIYDYIRTKKNSNIYNLFRGNALTGKIKIPPVGDIIDTGTATVIDGGYMYAISDCNKRGSILISGWTGDITNYPIYTFCDNENRVILKCSKTNLSGDVITVPYNAKTVILNAHTYNGSAEFYALDNAYASKFNSNFNFGNIASDAPSTFYSYKNGKNLSHDLNEYVVPNFGKTTDKMVHVGTCLKINGVYYATYYANTETTAEDPLYQEARFVIYNGEYEYHTIFKANNTFDGKTITAVYDTILMTLDNNTLIIGWTAALNNVYYRLYQTYNVTTKQFGAINYCTINNNVWSTTNFEQLMPSQHKTVFSDIGLMATLSSRVENNETWWYTGSYYGGFTCIVKTKDCINWEYVTTPPAWLPTVWENPVYVVGNKVFYYVRCNNTVNYDLLMTFDLETMQWEPQLKIPDCHSRGCFFMRNNVLYLAHAPFNRDCIELITIDTENPQNSKPYALGCRANTFYPFVSVTNDNEVLLTYTDNRQAIRTVKLNMPYSSFMDCYNQ